MIERACIVNLDTREIIPCMFNPKEYTFSKRNNWQPKSSKGNAVPHLEYGGGASASLKLQLLFDSLEDHAPLMSAGKDVRLFTRGLWDLMKPTKGSKNTQTGMGQPPICRFEWGHFWTFKAVIESLSQKFTLFAKDGTPLRAIVDVDFKQIEDEGQYPRQNPTSGGESGSRLYTVREGDTLSGIANEMYGDPTVWRTLARVNQIADPRRLRTGRVLLINPLAPLKNRLEGG